MISIMNVMNDILNAESRGLIHVGILMLAWLPAVYILQIIIHEGGHCFFGIISGYRLLSFRIGGMTLVSENGKLQIKLYSTSGSAGQCLMIPREANQLKSHYILYILGGIMADMILFLCAGALAIGNWNVSIHVRCGAFIYSLYSLICIARNAIPKIDGVIMNDGTSLYLLLRDRKAVRYFFQQLEIMAKLQSGVLLRKLPKERIQVSKTADLSNEMIAWSKILESYYYMDLRNWNRALEAILLLEEAYQHRGNSVLLRNTVQLEKLYLFIKLGKSDQEIRALYEVAEAILVRRGKDFNILRVQAAYELYKSRFMESKCKVRKAMNHLRSSYPYKGEAAFCCGQIRDMLKEG